LQTEISNIFPVCYQPVIQNLRHKRVKIYEGQLKREFSRKKGTSEVRNMQDNSIEM